MHALRSAADGIAAPTACAAIIAMPSNACRACPEVRRHGRWRRRGRAPNACRKPWPSAFRIHQSLRVDRDTTRNRAGRDALFMDLAKPGARILIDTQMLAKGLICPT